MKKNKRSLKRKNIKLLGSQVLCLPKVFSKQINLQLRDFFSKEKYNQMIETVGLKNRTSIPVRAILKVSSSEKLSNRSSNKKKMRKLKSWTKLEIRVILTKPFRWRTRITQWRRMKWVFVINSFLNLYKECPVFQRLGVHFFAISFVGFIFWYLE